jgi:hypothetical protein
LPCRHSLCSGRAALLPAPLSLLRRGARCGEGCSGRKLRTTQPLEVAVAVGLAVPLLVTEVNDDWIQQWDRFSPGNASMKRPTRPFVVEVKKRRGSPAKPQSIWGDLDLSVLTADPSAVTELNSEAAGNDRDPDPAVEVDRASNTGSAIQTPSEDGDAHAIADGNHAEPHPTDAETEGAADKPARSPRKLVRRHDQPNLPRGQRWKRRLPRALRR